MSKAEVPSGMQLYSALPKNECVLFCEFSLKKLQCMSSVFQFSGSGYSDDEDASENHHYLGSVSGGGSDFGDDMDDDFDDDYADFDDDYDNSDDGWGFG